MYEITLIHAKLEGFPKSKRIFLINLVPDRGGNVKSCQPWRGVLYHDLELNLDLKSDFLFTFDTEILSKTR